MTNGWRRPRPRASPQSTTPGFRRSARTRAPFFRSIPSSRTRSGCRSASGASYLVNGPPVGDATAYAQDLAKRISTDLVQARFLKIIGDGTQEGYTAWLVDPYADKPNSIGASPFTEAEWKSMIADADRAGIDVHVHACGERTARTALDAFEAAIAANPPRDRRHTIAHNVLTEDSDIPEVRKARRHRSVLGQLDDGRSRHRRHPHRALRPFPAEPHSTGRNPSFRLAGAYLSARTGRRRAISRPTSPSIRFPGRRDAPADRRRGPAHPQARRRAGFDLAEALHASTMGSAYQLRLDDRVGSIKVGKRADLIVLERNLFDINQHKIAATRVDMTMRDGRFTHRT